MTILKQVTQSQLQKELTINENFNAVSPSAIFAHKGGVNSLTFSFYGGRFQKLDGTTIDIADGFILLADNTTHNFVEYDTATDTVVSNVIAFTSGNIPIADITTSAGLMTSIVDCRIHALYAKGTRTDLVYDVLQDSITDTVINKAPTVNAVYDALALKQDSLASGTNIKTINGSSILGAGDLVIGGSGGGSSIEWETIFKQVSSTGASGSFGRGNLTSNTTAGYAAQTGLLGYFTPSTFNNSTTNLYTHLIQFHNFRTPNNVAMSKYSAVIGIKQVETVQQGFFMASIDGAGMKLVYTDGNVFYKTFGVGSVIGQDNLHILGRAAIGDTLVDVDLGSDFPAIADEIYYIEYVFPKRTVIDNKYCDITIRRVKNDKVTSYRIDLTSDNWGFNSFSGYTFASYKLTLITGTTAVQHIYPLELAIKTAW